MIGFGVARDPERAGLIPRAAHAIKQWTREALSLTADTMVSVNELACAQPECPPLQTVILVLPDGAPAMKLPIHKALLEVSEGDVRRGWAEIGLTRTE